MIGKTFGRLTVVAPAAKTDRHLKWECLCVCGNLTKVRASSLRTGITTSCGCANRDAVTTHGGKKTRLYQTWINMRRRCTDTKATDYKNYGALGITYAHTWDNFAVFREWAIKAGYTDELTIDRIHVEGNYEPDNCKWSDWNTQAANQRKAANTSSKYLGVSLRGSKWEASIKRSGVAYYVGTFDTELEAAIARDDFIKTNNWPHKLNF